MNATTTTRYWMSDNGSITCEQHAGSYLTCGLEAHPRAKEHHTPLGTWVLMDEDEVLDFQQFLASELHKADLSCCEECRGWE